MSQQLEQLLQRCTVKISIPGNRGWGTGFFVAPGLILTCHHVFKEAKNDTAYICWQNQENFEALIERSLPDFDLALLRFSPSVVDLPCVYLDESFQADDRFYTYGYPDDFPQGASVTGKCEGIAIDKQQSIKFKAGQVRPGLSGSPLLNQRTGKVCGIVKFTRDRSIDLGGGAIPVSEILSQFPQLSDLQQEFHFSDKRWQKLLPRPFNQKPLSRQKYRNRQNLLNKVSNFWIKGVLEKSLYNEILIQLDLERRPDAVSQPWNMVLQIPDEEPQLLPRETKISDLFDNTGEGQTLLILGEPGSGKTTTLLQLARDLIALAEINIENSIPVIFNLSTWVDKNQSIKNWLIEELSNKYQVPKKIGKSLLEEDKLILLLDGLDEVKTECREQCIEALNKFNLEHCPEIVVCSRLQDYQVLSQRLNFQSAICLRTLTLDEVRHYLNSFDADFTKLKVAIERDTVLQELAKSPLMLNIMATTYQDVAETNFLETKNVEEKRQQLFNAYIKKMFQRRGKNQKYTQAQTINWLVWLAQKMVQKSQTVFLIEQMQPTWLPKNPQKWLYVIIMSSIFGLIPGLFTMSSASELIANEVEIASEIIFFFGLLAFLIPYGLPISLVLARHIIWNKPALFKTTLSTLSQIWLQLLKMGALIGTIVGLQVFLVLTGLPLVIKNIEGFSLLKSVAYSLLVGIIFSLMLVLFVGLLSTFTFPFKEKIPLYKNIKIQNIFCERIEPVETIKWSTKRAIAAFVVSLVFIFQLGIKIGLLYGLIVAILLGFSPSQDIESKTIPNQGIKQSFKNSLVFGLGISIVMITTMDFAPESSFNIGELKSFLKIFMVWTIYGSLIGDGGATLKHFILRLILNRNNYIPWNYARFLDYASERIFLRKVGGGYIFIHRMLMEHFARM